jgi:hypothetical protein
LTILNKKILCNSSIASRYKNSTGKVSHLQAWIPDVNLTNKVKGMGPNKGIFRDEIASSKNLLLPINIK